METNFTLISESGNPWISEVKSLSGLKKALLLGEKTGHIANRSEFEDGKQTNEAEGHLPSIKLIQVLKKLSKGKADLNKINLEIQCRMQDRETKDITHMDILEQRIAKIKSLNSHIESVIEGKEQLIQRMQQPFQGEYLKVEAQYHRAVCDFFPQIAPMLSDLSTNLENITWAKSLSLKDGKLDSLITELCSVLNAMETGYRSYCQIHQSVGQLHSLQTGVLHSTHIDGHP